MLARKIYVILLAAIGTFFSGCQNDTPLPDEMPYVLVNEVLFINTIEAQPLQARDGAAIYYKGGLKGLIIYRVNAQTFRTFERQNPNSGGCILKISPDKFTMLDSCTNSRHGFDGRSIQGSDRINLRQYNTNFDGQKIIITN